MSDDVKIALIVAIPPTLLALASFMVAVANLLATQSTHKAVNSRLTALLELTARASHAEGVALGKTPDRPTAIAVADT